MKHIILITALALLASVPVSADVLDIPATAVYILNSPTESNETRAMVRFDLSGLHSKILTAYMDWDLAFEATEGDAAEAIEVKCRVLQARWNETTKSWTDLDAFAGDREKGAWGASAGTEETVRLSMTDVVQSWVKFPLTNFGLVVELEGDILAFDAEYVGGQIKKPILRVWTTQP